MSPLLSARFYDVTLAHTAPPRVVVALAAGREGAVLVDVHPVHLAPLEAEDLGDFYIVRMSGRKVVIYLPHLLYPASSRVL